MGFERKSSAAHLFRPKLTKPTIKAYSRFQANVTFPYFTLFIKTIGLRQNFLFLNKKVKYLNNLKTEEDIEIYTVIYYNLF